MPRGSRRPSRRANPARRAGARRTEGSITGFLCARTVRASSHCAAGRPGWPRLPASPLIASVSPRHKDDDIAAARARAPLLCPAVLDPLDAAAGREGDLGLAAAPRAARRERDRACRLVSVAATGSRSLPLGVGERPDHGDGPAGVIAKRQGHRHCSSRARSSGGRPRERAPRACAGRPRRRSRLRRRRSADTDPRRGRASPSARARASPPRRSSSSVTRPRSKAPGSPSK